jgi:hypothetical protein
VDGILPRERGAVKGAFTLKTTVTEKSFRILARNSFNDSMRLLIAKHPVRPSLSHLLRELGTSGSLRDPYSGMV